jgi:protein involved in polysaccharide export with SLBB domain
MLLFMCALDVGTLGAAAPREGYRIGPNDIIRIQVFGEDDLTVESKVSGDGKINYPLLGMIRVDGRTIEEVQKELTGRLAAGYVRAPKVSVSIVQHRNFYVSGEVKAPGGYPYQEGLTIQKALSLAGGFSDKAGTGEIKVTRVIGGRPETIAVNLNTVVFPEDFIIVERLQKVYVNGEVKKPGDYPYEKNITLHKVITMAGGFTDKASESRTKVLRVIEGHEQSIRLKLEDVVLPEDIIVVPRSFF